MEYSLKIPIDKFIRPVRSPPTVNCELLYVVKYTFSTITKFIVLVSLTENFEEYQKLKE